MRRALALWLLLFAAYAATLGLSAFGSSEYAGDEPHYLLAAKSIVEDGDVDVLDEYAARAYSGFYPYELRPHGSTTEPLLKADSVNETCYGCHADLRGPFLFEHAPVRDNCVNCHQPHGSNHEALLVTTRPLLCQQCHAQPGHPSELLTRGNMANGPRPDIRLMNRGCSNCHSQIHGSNHPSGSRFQR